jgi:sec-independent protein translocase protein TatA
MQDSIVVATVLHNFKHPLSPKGLVRVISLSAAKPHNFSEKCYIRYDFKLNARALKLSHSRRRNNMFEGLLQPTHLIVILGLALLMFGPKKLPELGKGLGEGIRGFKKAMAEIGNDK